MFRRVACLAILAVTLTVRADDADRRDAILIDLDAAGKIRVRSVNVADVERTPPPLGLLVLKPRPR